MSSFEGVDFKLYGFYRSSCSWRVRTALKLKGIKYEYFPINIQKGESRTPEFLAINPNGKVPCLVINGIPVSQSLAILEYLEENFPSVPLLPTDPVQRALSRMIAATIACEIQPLQNPFMTFGFDAEGHAQHCHDVIAAGLGRVEKMLETHSGVFSVGDTLSYADLFLVPQVYNAKRFNVDLSTMPNIMRVRDHCLTLDVFKETQPEMMIDCPDSMKISTC